MPAIILMIKIFSDCFFRVFFFSIDFHMDLMWIDYRDFKMMGFAMKHQSKKSFISSFWSHWTFFRFFKLIFLWPFLVQTLINSFTYFENYGVMLKYPGGKNCILKFLALCNFYTFFRNCILKFFSDKLKIVSTTV